MSAECIVNTYSEKNTFIINIHVTRDKQSIQTKLSNFDYCDSNKDLTLASYQNLVYSNLFQKGSF